MVCFFEDWFEMCEPRALVPSAMRFKKGPMAIHRPFFNTEYTRLELKQTAKDIVDSKRKYQVGVLFQICNFVWQHRRPVELIDG